MDYLNQKTFFPRHSLYTGVFALQVLLNTLIPVLKCSKILSVHSMIYLQDFYFPKFLVLKYLKNTGTQTALPVPLISCGRNRSEEMKKSFLIQWITIRTEINFKVCQIIKY